MDVALLSHWKQIARPYHIIIRRRHTVRPYSVGGIVMILLGVLSLSIRNFTFFAQEQVVGPMGIFAWDVSRPHTIFINPIAGILAVAIGIGLLIMSRRGTAS
jgi:hypothetical protein